MTLNRAVMAPVEMFLIVNVKEYRYVKVNPLGEADELQRLGGCTTPRHRLVLPEGDWKAASIPLPWIGLGLLGKTISDEQVWTIKTSNPHSVIVMLDGGFDREAQDVYQRLLPLDVKIARLPPTKGPDDIPRRDLVRLLLSLERVCA